MKIKRNTKRFYLYEMFSTGISKANAFATIRPQVVSQTRPWIFSANVNGSRIAKPIAEQLVELQHEINRAYVLFAKGEKDGKKPEIEDSPEDDSTTCDDCRKVRDLHFHEESGLSLCDSCIAKRETPLPEPVRAKGKTEIDRQKRIFFDEWKRIRAWIHQVAAGGTIPVDSLDSNRPVEDARPLIEAGISAETLIGAMCLHWSDATKAQAGVKNPDYLKESEYMGDDFHKLAGYVFKLAKARTNIMLIGPSGTGKSFLAKQVAAAIKTESHPDGLPYGETPMTPGATRGDLLGRHTISGFITSQFVEIYAGGGVFNFEEMDASDPSMLIVVNNALASNHLYNSANGEVYDRHPDFIAISTANTFGLGADAKYTGREKLDLATIDRFRMGRVLIDLDENIVERMMFA